MRGKGGGGGRRREEGRREGGGRNRPAQRAAHGTTRRGTHEQGLTNAKTGGRMRGTSSTTPRTRHRSSRAHSAAHAAPQVRVAQLARQRARGTICTAPRQRAARRASNCAPRAWHARAREQSTAQHCARSSGHATPQIQPLPHDRRCVNGTARAAQRRNAACSAHNARRRANDTAGAAPRTRAAHRANAQLGACVSDAKSPNEKHNRKS